MLPRSFTDKIQGNVSKLSFWKSPPQGKNWKSKSMRIIPEEFMRSTEGGIEHRLVCSASWGNSWQFWLQREKKGLVILKEDWDDFVDQNLLGPNDVLFFAHEEIMFLQVRIFKKDGKEIIEAPVEHEPETEPFHLTPQNAYQETTPASASASGGTWLNFSASGGTDGRARRGSGSCDVNNPERYLLNPKNPFFVKTLTKKNDVLYVPKPTIYKYGLMFGPTNSAMSYLLPEGKEEGWTKIYGNSPCFNGWTNICRKHNLNIGDSVVCELELSGGVVAAVRLHFPNK
ncbi:unnamed protein product [Arabis nemorensis]|uniref:TF-B3 domain-containing protein n=1 Tax=Arabis nemorensis TaxID=586526 RepID=A0A565CUW4_9BRAS|nr:unnamed protein product [Arabis nemorensis]